jgi:stage III sporulation protein SpoIIIAA
LDEGKIIDNFAELMAIFPPKIARGVEEAGDFASLIEIVLDLGRKPEARYTHRYLELSDEYVTRDDLEYACQRIGEFGRNNRAGIERTLHRISAIRNRNGEILGLTCRLGRAVYGTVDILRDIVESPKSILLLGRPGVGKTTMLREIARILSTDFNKRVIIVDTSNEIAGDGDIPHPAIGRARRMQVPFDVDQHAVMIEAVENHMPEVIIIDEIGNEMEAKAARTIAERGVQLIATAHGNTLHNLIMNPVLVDLVGGIQAVTLGDEEARRRGTQKTVLERKAPPTFDVVVEIKEKNVLGVHLDVAQVVDEILQGRTKAPQMRSRKENGEVVIEEPPDVPLPFRGKEQEGETRNFRGKSFNLLPFGVNRDYLERGIKRLKAPIHLTKHLEEADAMLVLKKEYRKRPSLLVKAEGAGIPVYIVKSNTIGQVMQALTDLPIFHQEDELQAVEEAKEAVRVALQTMEPVKLSAQGAKLRRIQHRIAEQNGLESYSIGREPNRHVVIYKA